MTSIFFQISPTDYLEAAKIHDRGGKDYAIRIVSFAGGRQHYVYLPEVTLNELSLLASILNLKLVPTYNRLTDLRNYINGVVYYYY